MVLKQQETCFVQAPPQAAAETVKKMAAMTQALRRICMPKQASGRLEVSPEVHRMFKAGGEQRQVLISQFIQSGCNKDTVRGQTLIAGLSPPIHYIY